MLRQNQWRDLHCPTHITSKHTMRTCPMTICAMQHDQQKVFKQNIGYHTILGTPTAFLVMCQAILVTIQFLALRQLSLSCARQYWLPYNSWHSDSFPCHVPSNIGHHTILGTPTAFLVMCQAILVTIQFLALRQLSLSCAKQYWLPYNSWHSDSFPCHVPSNIGYHTILGTPTAFLVMCQASTSFLLLNTSSMDHSKNIHDGHIK